MWTGCVWGGTRRDPKHLLSLWDGGISNKLREPMAQNRAAYWISYATNAAMTCVHTHHRTCQGMPCLYRVGMREGPHMFVCWTVGAVRSGEGGGEA